MMSDGNMAWFACTAAEQEKCATASDTAHQEVVALLVGMGRGRGAAPACGGGGSSARLDAGTRRSKLEAEERRHQK